MPFDEKSYVSNEDEGALTVSGFMVGMGIAWSGGCTFGHAMTGLPRGKAASFLAVLLFFSAAVLTNKY
jgi:uncharacterized membrane protein YedE/YeeE